MKQALHVITVPVDRLFRFGLWGLSLGLGMLCTMQLQGQSFGTSECNCISGASNPANGLFSDFVSINSGISGQTWTVVTSTNMFDAGSAGALIPLAPGTVIPQTSTGRYALETIRITDTDFTITVTDGVFTYPLTSRHTCSYPDTRLVGDFGSCVGSTETYELPTTADKLDNIIWTVTNGTIVSGQGSRLVRVQWSAVPSIGTVRVTGEASGHPDNTGTYCSFDITETVDVLSEQAEVIACNNKVNISMNGSCEITITPSLILEDMQFTNASYDLVIRDIKADTIITDDVLTGKYLNTDIEVKVIHECSKNACWGTLRLEDKSVPTLDCGDDVTIDCDELNSPFVTGFPIPMGSDITQIDENTFFVDGFDQCGGLTLDFYDEVAANECQGSFSSIITRIWRATDSSGNTDTCSSQIFIRRATFADLTFPPIYDDVLGTRPSIKACSKYDTLDNGYPSPDFTGRPEGTFCLNVQVDYTDVLIEGCSEEAYKIKRRWVVTDLCHVEGDTVYNQIITIADDQPPVCSAPDEFEVGTNPLTCSSTIDVPPPTVIFECSDWDYFVSYKLTDDGGSPFNFSTTDGVIRRPNGTYRITNIPEGQLRVWVVYNIEDACGNVTQCFTEVDIIDNEEPIPVCDLHTFVALNEDGIGYANPLALDDGSLDNCALDSMDIRRMDDACGEVSAWSQHIKFCCEDIGSTVMVALGVFDASGNSKQGMVEVEVQDNLAPRILTRPADVTVDCQADLSTLTRFGTITAEDNCGFIIEESEDRSNGNCGNGLITRTFKAIDNNGNVATHTQRITIVNTDPFFINPFNPNATNDDVIWPRDYTINNGCLDSDTDPDALPSANSRPQIFANSCSEVSVTHEDIVFQYTDGACFKILRKWTVIDFCQFNPFFPDAGGKWDYTQVIKVNNNVRPTISTGCRPSDLTVTQLADCRARINISASGEDDCTPADKLKFNYEIDLGNNGTVDVRADGRSINREVPFGEIKITWNVEDQCGNTNSCSRVFTIGDDKAPTPYCLAEIVTVVMETDGTAEIWASDFNRGSFDNCTDTTDLVFSLSSNTAETSRTFTCDDLDSTRTRIDLEMWVTDNAGNQDFCNVTLILQDNNDACGFDDVNGNGGTGNQRIAIAGKVATEQSEGLDQVEVMIEANISEFPAYEYTDGNGGYAFNDLNMYHNYRISASKTGDYDKGISTLDLVFISRHILGISLLDSPYKIIAADINNNGSVSGADVVALRKFILGITSDFPDNDSWRFAASNQIFADPTDPFPFLESIGYENLDQNMAEVDFVAIKIGDVNNSLRLQDFQGENAESRSTAQLSADVSTLGEDIQIPVSIMDASEVFGLQLALHFDAEAMQIIDIVGGGLDLDMEDISLDQKDGQLLLSWHSATPVQLDAETTLFTIKAVKKGKSVGHISLNETAWANEIYTEQGGIITSKNVNLRTSGTKDNGEFRLYQNVPNPFEATTEIAFDLPVAGKASLKVFDINGRLIKEVSSTYPKGYNTITLNVEDLDASGILYYQLDSYTNSASKKMVVIK